MIYRLLKQRNYSISVPNVSAQCCKEADYQATKLGEFGLSIQKSYSNGDIPPAGPSAQRTLGHC